MNLTEHNVLVAVDGANVRGALEGPLGGMRMDGGRFLVWVAMEYGCPDAYWFQGDYPGMRHVYTHLQDAGFEVITEEPQRGPDGRLRANMDTTIAATVASVADRYDTVLLVSGDGDFEPLARRLRASGKRVVVIAHADTLNPVYRLCSEPDDVVDLADIIGYFGFEPRRQEGPDAA